MAYKRFSGLGGRNGRERERKRSHGPTRAIKKKKPASPLAPSILYGHRRPRLYRDSGHTSHSSEDSSQNRTMGCK